MKKLRFREAEYLPLRLHGAQQRSQLSLPVLLALLLQRLPHAAWAWAGHRVLLLCCPPQDHMALAVEDHGRQKAGFSKWCLSLAVMGCLGSLRSWKVKALPCHSTTEAGTRGPSSRKGGSYYFLPDTSFYYQSQSSKCPVRSQPQELEGDK